MQGAAMQDFTVSSQSQTAVDSVTLVNRFMRGVYLWMTLALVITAGAAWYAAHSPAVLNWVYGTKYAFMGLIIAELAVVFWLSASIHKMSSGMATGLFVLYSVLNGVTLSVILLVYAQSDIATAFLITAGMFAAMSLYGMTTKKDLTSWRSFLFMGLIGLLIAMVVNMFVGGTTMQLVISGVAVILFTLLTAYDTQKLKVMGESAPHDDATAIRRGTILGALTLYLDFINLFLHILRILAASRR